MSRYLSYNDLDAIADRVFRAYKKLPEVQAVGQILYYSLRVPYRKKAKWIMNDAKIGALRKLKDLNGQYLWQPFLNKIKINPDDNPECFLDVA